MSELSNQVQAHKARLQRFAEAAAKHENHGSTEIDIKQAAILEGYLMPERHAASSVLPPIPNEVIAAAAEIAFPRMILSRIEAIQRATLREFPKITMFDLKSQRRTAEIVKARQVAMYLAKKLTSQSLPEVGRKFGGRDHTTVLHAVRKIGALVDTNPELAAQIERITESVPEVGI
jgi:hypothetical protein